MGESGVPEPGRASIQNITPELAKSESKSGAITKSGGNLEATVSGAASAVRSSTTTADSEHTDGHLVAGDATGLPGKAAMTTDAEGLQSLQYNASLAHLEAAFTQAQEGSTSQQQLTDLDSLTRQSLDSSASKRQLTSVHSMQNESALDSSKKRTVRHSLSGKISTLPAAVPTSSSYSGRYATRQLSGKASPASTDDGVSPRRSLLASPAVSIHGGLPAAVQHPSKPGSIKPPSGVRGDDGPGATLAGAVAVLKSHARPSSVDGAGWHLATGDGLPFSPRGSLVASSGGSRTLRPITSQQEALFDAEGNMLSRNQGQPGAAQTGGKTDIQQGSAPGSKTVSAGAVNAEAGSLPAKQKIPAKHGMMSVVMWPCFCMRSRTTSVEDPYLQGSLRQQFADKEAAAGAHSTLASKGMPTLKAAVKQKQPGSDMGSDVGGRDWDLGTKVHEADSADAADVQLSEAENPGEDGRRLQGAISLAPKHGGLAGSQPHQAPLQEAPEVISWSLPCHHQCIVGTCSSVAVAVCTCQSGSSMLST